MSDLYPLDSAVNPWPQEYPDLVLPGGSLCERDQHAILKYTNVEFALDLGTHFGRSAAIASLKAKRVVTMDIWNDEERAKDYLAPFKNVEIMKHDSRNPHPDIDAIDFLFIDTQHYYEEVIQTFYSWFPRMRKGGVIMFHDYLVRYPGVMRAVDEIRYRMDLDHIEQPGYSDVLRKK